MKKDVHCVWLSDMENQSQGCQRTAREARKGICLVVFIPHPFNLLYFVLRYTCFLYHFCRILYFINFTDLGSCHKIQKSLKAFQISLIITSYTLVWHDDLHRVLSMHFLTWYIYAEIPYIQENFGKSALFCVSMMSPWSDLKNLGGHLRLWIFQW